MKSKNKLIVILFLVFLVVCRCSKSVEGFEKNIDDLTFSKTQKWGKFEWSAADKLNRTNQNILRNLPIIPFPKNSSYQTKTELRDILKKRKELNEKHMKQIVAEREWKNTIKQFGVKVDEEKRLDNYIFQKVQPIHLTIKRHFDRVRPSFLDKKIVPVIRIPAHGAYPSGHSTEAWSLAFCLSDKYPKRKNKYYAIANNIATNRERAGLHYKSDSDYGKLLARKILDLVGSENHPLLGKY